MKDLNLIKIHTKVKSFTISITKSAATESHIKTSILLHTLRNIYSRSRFRLLHTLHKNPLKPPTLYHIPSQSTSEITDYQFRPSKVPTHLPHVDQHTFIKLKKRLRIPSFLSFCSFGRLDQTPLLIIYHRKRAREYWFTYPSKISSVPTLKDCISSFSSIYKKHYLTLPLPQPHSLTLPTPY